MRLKEDPKITVILLQRDVYNLFNRELWIIIFYVLICICTYNLYSEAGLSS